MKRWHNILIQFSASAGQIANIWFPFVAEEHRPIVTAVLGTVQLGTAIIAHSFNPDGTPAEKPFVKPAEKTEK